MADALQLFIAVTDCYIIYIRRCQVFLRSSFHLSNNDFSNPKQASADCRRARLSRSRRFFRRFVRGLCPATCGSPSLGTRTKRRFLRCELFFFLPPVHPPPRFDVLTLGRNTGVVDTEYPPTCQKSSTTGAWRTASASSVSGLTGRSSLAVSPLIFLLPKRNLGARIRKLATILVFCFRPITVLLIDRPVIPNSRIRRESGRPFLGRRTDERNRRRFPVREGQYIRSFVYPPKISETPPGLALRYQEIPLSTWPGGWSRIQGQRQSRLCRHTWKICHSRVWRSAHGRRHYWR
jgi:hypothetical protein